MDIIQRNIERLIYLDDPADREAIEPMSEWKWQQLYKTVEAYGLGPWIVASMPATIHGPSPYASTVLYSCSHFHSLMGSMASRSAGSSK
jgi:hypothetical protein